MDLEKFTDIENAKTFLRHNKQQTSVSDVMDIIELVKSKCVSIPKETEIIADNISKTSDVIIKTLKQRYLHRKITVASICAFITILWAFPSTITDHPILGDFFYTKKEVYCFLSYIWLITLIISIVVLLFSYRSEKFAKNILHYMQNEDSQYIFFRDFINDLSKKNKSSIEFTKKDLENFLHTEILHQAAKVKIGARQLLYFGDIIPKISDMIIARALERSVIIKKSDSSWYDTYVLCGNLQ